MPKSIPCTDKGKGVCEWDFTVTLTETGGVDVTITNLDIQFGDAQGNVWTSSGGGEYGLMRVLQGNGSFTYDSWVSSTAGHSLDLRGGTVTVTYRGYVGGDVLSAAGALPRGSVTATLAP